MSISRQQKHGLFTEEIVDRRWPQRHVGVLARRPRAPARCRSASPLLAETNELEIVQR